jgi:hypothetical protein
VTARPRPLRRLLLVLLLLTGLFGALNVAFAATLPVQAGKLAAFSQPVDRCAPSIPLARVENATQLLALVGYDVPAACVGRPVQATVFGTNGALLGAGTSTAASPSFTVPLSPLATKSSVAGRAMAVGGLGVATTGPQTLLFVLDDWFYGYCADVTLSTTSTTPTTTTKTVALTTYPVNGVARNNTQGAVTQAAGTVSIGGTLSQGAPLTGRYCADRTEPPPTGSVTYTVSVSPNNVSQFDASQWHPNNSTGGTLSSSYGATTSYDASTSTITASGVDSTQVIPVGGSVTWGYCMSGMQPFVPPGATFNATVTVNAGDHWGTGYNAAVQVTTDSTTPVAWEVDLDMSQYGVTTNLSSGNANLTHLGGGVWRATGRHSLATVVVGTPVNFSINASSVTASSPRRPDLTGHTVTWNGNCATVTVSSSSPTWHAWEVAVDLSGRTGTPGNRSGAATNATSNWNGSTRTLTAWGGTGTWHLRQGTTRSFQFCMQGG